ncbi:hypothetical protein GW17_00053974 [Ensete ventricosum]|nr:hypothetical protein GW17_00053974 [Ensete ventricosum]
MYVHKPKDTDKHEHFIKHLVYILTVTARYRAVPPKSAVDGRLREKSGRLREKKGRRRRGKRKKRSEEEKLAPVLARASSSPSPTICRCAVARGSPAPVAARARRCPRPSLPAPVAARTRTRRQNVSPHGEKDRGHMFSAASNVTDNHQNHEAQKHCILVAASNPHPLPTPVYRPPVPASEHKETGEVQTENGLADAETVAKSFVLISSQ